MYFSSFSTSALLSALLAVLRLTVAAPAGPQATVGWLLSLESRRFLMFSEKGDVSANGDFRKY
jgi:hypothetical protein